MKSPLASAILLASALALFVSGALVTHKADPAKSQLTATSSPAPAKTGY
jgi:hypothetical protein